MNEATTTTLLNNEIIELLSKALTYTTPKSTEEFAKVYSDSINELSECWKEEYKQNTNFDSLKKYSEKIKKAVDIEQVQFAVFFA